VKPLVVAMSAFVLLAAPGLAGAGSPAATQYPNPTALIGAAPPSISEPPGSTGLTTGTGTPAGTPANGHHGATPARPPSLVGVAAGPGHPLGPVDTVKGTLPTAALWAVAFAAVCALVAAWLIRLR